MDSCCCIFHTHTQIIYKVLPEVLNQKLCSTEATDGADNMLCEEQVSLLSAHVNSVEQEYESLSEIGCIPEVPIL